MNSKNAEKVRLFALIEPINVKMTLCFASTALVCNYFI